MGRGWWYRPSGDEFYNSAPRNGKPYNRADARRKCTPFGTFGTTFPPEGNRGAFPSRHRRGRMVFPLLLPVTAQYANYLPRPAPKGTRDPLPQAAFITSSEPARSVGGTHRSARSARTIEPGRRRRLNPLAYRGYSLPPLMPPLFKKIFPISPLQFQSSSVMIIQSQETCV